MSDLHMDQAQVRSAARVGPLTTMALVFALGIVNPGITSTLSAAEVEPSTQPTLTLSPYVLRNTDLELGPTKAYRPWFENGAWMGDLIEYNISTEGNRCTTVAVGAYPPRQQATPNCTGGQNWSVREQLPERDEDGNLDEAESDGFWQDRNVITAYRCLDSDSCTRTEGARIAFWWDQLSEAQRTQLDPTTALNEDATAAGDSPVLNFLRGDRSGERDQPGGIFRLRYSLMSDIVNSRPVYLPTGGAGTVVVGANGGMLHGFNAGSGEEVFAYVPSMLMNRLSALTRSPYRHTYFVDGDLRGRSISNNRHIVTGGLGAGGKGLFALNVANSAEPQIQFELSEEDANVGHIHGRPTIARLNGGSTYQVVSGNGYLNADGAAELLIVSVSNGSVSAVPVPDSGNGNAANGLSAPILVARSDGSASHAYAGDLNGNLWRFDFTGDNSASVRLVFSDPNQRPITTAPDVARGPGGAGHMVYFGTGSLLSRADSDDTSPNAVYGIWDRGPSANTVTMDRLVSQRLLSVSESWDGRERIVRIVGDTNSDADIISPDQITSVSVTEPQYADNGESDLGWRVVLPAAGERVIGSPQIRGNRLQMVTLNPTLRENDVQTNESWIVQFNLATGATPGRPLFDLDRDGFLTEDDGLTVTVDEETTTVFPMALLLGPGNIAQPAFARIADQLDAVFINGLLLPEPTEAGEASLVFGGNINVTTDSPSGPMINPHTGPLPSGFEKDPDYPDDGRTTDRDIDARGPMNVFLDPDGLGRRLDGHHHSYDKVHGVNYIDYFDLEPRRGLLSLNLTRLVAIDETEDVDQSYRVLPELNRLTEVSGLSGSQRFLVMLTNADLSQGTEIRIGCRSYDAYDYQRIVTRYLLLNDSSSHEISLTDADLIPSGETPRSLIFSRDEIDPSNSCADGTPSTLRISMTERVGLEDVLHGTMAGCVANSHNYDGLPLTPEQRDSSDIFVANPHITPNQEGGSQGYRWRNGALTMQLLAVGEGNEKAFRLQRELRPRRNNMEIPPLARPTNPQGDGGLYALAFRPALTSGPPADRRDAKLVSDPELSGLLYESSVFWNIGDMFQFQQQGQATRCYGASVYSAGIRNEWFGLNSGQYDGLVSELRDNPDLVNEYAQLLAELAEAALLGEEGSETIQRVLGRLAELFGESAGSWGVNTDLTLADYHRLRSYAHGDQFNLNLLSIDEGLFSGSPDIDLDQDGTPAEVSDIELDLLPAAGPNYQPGRRSWTDIELE